ncbi:MAG: DivIVA domain-containing protein [Nocardioidaceae bacterium]
MIWFLGVLLVLVVGVLVILMVGRGEAMQRVYDDRPDALVPRDAPISGSDLRSVRFSVGLRGYRMDEVDALLARLSEQLDESRDPEEPS